MPRGVYPRRKVTREEYLAVFVTLYEEAGPDECWLWRGRKPDESPYGRFSLWGRDRGAHVAALVLRGIDVPTGRVVMHSCDVELCVNPRHLRVATQAENRRDAAKKGRTARGDQNGMRLYPGRSYFTRMKPEHRPRGESHGMAKLTAETVRQIRAEKIERRGDLARLERKYGISRTHIRRLQAGEGWAQT